MKQWKKWLLRLTAVAMICALVRPQSRDGLVMPASAITQAEIDAMKEDAQDLRDQQKEIQAQLEAIQADKDKALEQKVLVQCFDLLVFAGYQLFGFEQWLDYFEFEAEQLVRYFEQAFDL